MHELWMEEHFRAEEPLIADIDVNHVSIERLVDKLLELVRLHELTSRLICRLLVIRVKLFENILGHISVLFFDLSSDLVTVSRHERLAPIP